MHAMRNLVALALCLASAGVAAIDSSQLQALQWRSIGPFRGGRVVAVAGVPGEREHFYFGSVNGGVWETLDAGRTWQPIFDAESTGSIGAIALAPTDPRTIYVGTGEADMRSDIAQGDGMFKSRDGGKTWAHIGLADSQQIARIRVDPRDAERVFVAALGHPYGPNDQRGVFRSEDGGAHWQKVLGPNADTGAVDLVFDPSNPDVIYAALWQTRRTPWSVYPPSNGPGSAIYKSIDGGDHWTLINDGLPKAHGRVGLAIPLTESKRLYATIDAEPGGGLYRSDDGGAHWRLVNGDTRLWQRGWYFGEIAVDPSNAERIYALNTIVLRSDDGGAHFIAQKGDTTGDDFHAMWIDPNDSKRQILGVDQGAIVSLNGGDTWSSWLNQPTGQFYRVTTDNRFPYYVYGAQQDSGAAGVPSRTTHGDGINLKQFREVTAGGESDNIAPDPNDPDVIYGGRVSRLDLRTRQTRNIDPTLAYPDHHRRTWTLPLAFSVRDPKVLYFANQKLYRTADQGEHWDIISPDLTRDDPGTPGNLDAPTTALHLQMGPRRGVIYAIAPSRLADHDIWVGTDDGKVWRTRDEGKHWVEVTPKALTGWSKVGIIDASAHDAETATIAVDRHRLDDFRPYIYRTQDGGKSWKLIVDGIAATHFVNAVREDPLQRGLLYAGTERGVYFSLDSGVHWQPMQQNLPRTSVRDLVVKDNDLVIATHGRGFYILDDVSALRQLAADSAARTRLFAPAAAVRLRFEGFSGTPMPKDEPMAANPPSGAVIDYFLASAAKQPITLTLRDNRGEIVRTYSSADIPKPADAATSGAAPEWLPPPIALVNAPGMQRFIWPLRYAPPAVLASGDAYADGAWAPPGEYSVELNVDGARHQQTLRLLPDPRIALKSADYAEQFALARRIEGLRVQAASAGQEMVALQKALSTRIEGADKKTRMLFDAFQARLTAVTGTVPATNPSNSWWLPPKSFHSLRFIESLLGAVDSAVGDADAAPSIDARRGVDEAERRLPAVLNACKVLKQRDLAELNRKLAGMGLPLLETPAEAST
jgi:Sortilin, neurotensin receptor 3,